MAEIENILHQGQVSSYDEKKHTARVAFDDWEGMVSGDLQIIQPGVTRMRVKAPLQVGDHVACLFQANGIQEGYIIGSPYTSSNFPESGSENEYIIFFPDAPITVRVNVETKKIEVIAPNSDIVVECKTAKTTASETITANAGSSVTASAPTINLNGVLNVADQGGSGSTTAAINGVVNVRGDVIVNGISFIGHRHTCPDGTTSPPF